MPRILQNLRSGKNPRGFNGKYRPQPRRVKDCSKRYEAFHDPSLIVGRFWQITDFSSNQSGFLECEVFPICEPTGLASNPLLHVQEPTMSGYVLGIFGPGHGLAEGYVVLLRKRYEAFHDLSLIVGRF